MIKCCVAWTALVDAGYDPRRIILTIPLFRSFYETAETTMQFAADKGVEFINLIPLTSLGRRQGAW